MMKAMETLKSTPGTRTGRKASHRARRKHGKSKQKRDVTSLWYRVESLHKWLKISIPQEGCKHRAGSQGPFFPTAADKITPAEVLT